MKPYLFLLLVLNASSAFADEPWAYCDGNKRAYKVVQRFVSDCPKPPPHRPGEPATLPDYGHDPDLCTTREVSVSVNHPELDYICAYPTAYETGDAATKNTNRCINADAKFCQIGAGGVEGPGKHSIPGNAWYSIRGSSLAYPDVRCQCGCFVGSTLISSIAGTTRIDALAELAKAVPVGVLQLGTRGQSISVPLRGPDFTVGPEEKPVIRITTRAGRELSVTDIHPILVTRADFSAMVQAKYLEIGDELMDENGNVDGVLALESYKLDPSANNVYNLDTRSVDPEEHIISANNLRVGDVYWQKRLSEESSRIDNLLTSAAN